MARRRLILIGIVAAALVLRLAGLNSQGLWFDEGLTLGIARWPAFDLMFRPVDPTPGLYYLLHKLMIPPDAPLWAVRGISLAFGVAAVPLMYVLGRLSFGPAAGLIGAALLAVATSHVDYSLEARAYSLLVFLTLLAAVGVMRFATAKSDADRRLGLLLFAAGNVLAFYTHVTAAAFVATSSVVVLVTAWRRRAPWGEVIACFALMAALAAPGVWRLIEQQRVGHTFDWLPQATVEAFVRAVADAVLPLGLWENPYVGDRQLIRIAVAAGTALAALLVLRRYGRRALFNPAGGLILAFAAVPFLLWAVGEVGPPVLMARTLLPVLPGVLLAIAGVVIWFRSPVMIAAGLVGLYLGSTLLMGVQHDQQDLRAAAQTVTREARPGDTVILCPDAAYPALRYHAGRPAGSAVLLVTYEEQLLKAEGPFGSNRDWAETYFRSALRPDFDASAPKPEPGAYALPPGSAIFVIEAFCDDSLKEPLAAALEAADAKLEQRWRFPEWSGPQGDIHVLKYRAAGGATLPAVYPPRATNQPLRKPSAALP